MIPKIEAEIEASTMEEIDYSNQTYSIDLKRNIISGKCDGIDAVRQAIFLILNTERYGSLIMSANYGVELEDLIGMGTAYVISELKRRIKEALGQDDRISEVDNFNFEIKGNKIHCKFMVQTVFGTLNTEKEVVV